jgi:hypothetical protein
MLPMNKKEYAKWTEVRRSGNTRYALKTSFSATIIIFLLYFVTNGYINLANIDKYIAYNIANADAVFIALFITFVALFIVGKILFFINEKRYASTANNPDNQ